MCVQAISEKALPVTWQVENWQPRIELGFIARAPETLVLLRPWSAPEWFQREITPSCGNISDRLGNRK